MSSFHSTSVGARITLSTSEGNPLPPLAFRWFCPNPLNAFFLRRSLCRRLQLLRVPDHLGVALTSDQGVEQGGRRIAAQRC